MYSENYVIQIETVYQLVCWWLDGIKSMEDRYVKEDSVSAGILVAGWDKVNGGQVQVTQDSVSAGILVAGWDKVNGGHVCKTRQCTKMYQLVYLWLDVIKSMEDRYQYVKQDSVSAGILVAGWDKVNGGQVCKTRQCISSAGILVAGWDEVNGGQVGKTRH